jgi:hypothetical protein
MKKENPSAYLDIFREFEAVKRTVYTDKDAKVNMSIPLSILLSETSQCSLERKI